MTQLNLFNAGLNTRLAPHLLKVGEGVIYSNIDNTRGILEPAKQNKKYNPINKYFYRFNSNYYSTNEEAYFEEFGDYLYIATDKVRKTKDCSVIEDVGIAKPTHAPNIAATNAPDAPTTLNIVEDTGATVTAASFANYTSAPSAVFSFTNGSSGNLPDSSTYDYIVVDASKTFRHDFNSLTASDKSTSIKVHIVGSPTVELYRKYNGVYRLLGSIKADNVEYLVDDTYDIENKDAYYPFPEPATLLEYAIQDNDTGRIYKTSVTTSAVAPNVSRVVQITGIEGSSNYTIYRKFGDVYYEVSLNGNLDYKYNISDNPKLNYFKKDSTVIYRIRYKDSNGLYSEELVYSYKVLIECAALQLKDFNPSGLNVEIFRDGYLLYNGTANSVLDTGNALTTEYEVKTNPLVGSYKYCFTYYDGELESAPSEYSTLLENVNGFITVSNLDSSTPFKIRVYRIGGALSSATLCAEIPAASSYEDKTKDNDLTNPLILNTDDNLPPLAGLKYLREMFGIMFGAKGNKLYFSKQGYLDYWPENYWIAFPSEITGIGKVYGSLLVFLRNAIYVISGTSPETFVSYLLTAEQGCKNHRTIVSFKNQLFFVSNDGICQTNGGDVKVLSKDKLGKIDISAESAVLHDEIYYVLNDDKILAMDFRFGLIFKEFTRDNIDYLASFDDVLLGHNTDGYLYELFAADDDRTFTYKSPEFTEGSLTNLKAYKDFYLAYEGDINIKIYIDNKLVYDKNSLNNKDLLMPQNLQRGYSIQLELTGTGKVEEIEWKALGRQNGR